MSANKCVSIPAGSGMQRMLEAAKIVPKVGQCSYLVLLRFCSERNTLILDDVPAKVFSKIEDAASYVDFCGEFVNDYDEEDQTVNAHVEAERIVAKHPDWLSPKPEEVKNYSYVGAAILRIDAIENTCEIVKIELVD